MGQSASLLLCPAAGAEPAWRPPGPCEPRWPRVWTPDEMDSWAPLLAVAAALAGLVAGAVVCVAAHEAAHVAAAAALGLVPLRGPRGAAEAARGEQ
ncbi:hypothetical protein HYH03_005853 [Edaphochlamys debaryana]|uniref:Uncharacterized protein n=1 Tax=Edaphochlamys debaryana TaxID=47281 RepID=A0A835Y827_9CHLO|nr:hypothetical protein HYH03_005853 [Edaphochlamys debaryana]|eukprot:KAG2495921.1 hypothetical protein HYH03_005853 [Edaphochlamys debaryana]